MVIRHGNIAHPRVHTASHVHRIASDYDMDMEVIGPELGEYVQMALELSITH